MGLFLFVFLILVLKVSRQNSAFVFRGSTMVAGIVFGSTKLVFANLKVYRHLSDR